MKLKDRYAIITGASDGLGQEVARRFVAEGAGVLLCARRHALLQKLHEELLLSAQPGQTLAIMPLDVAKEKDVDSMVRCAADQFPRIDILVHCAGVAGPRGSADEVNWQEWKDAVEINLNGAVLTCTKVVREMKKNRYGKIVAIAGGGATKPLPGLACYAATKAASVRFMETLAHELKEFRIDVNSVAPGVLNTRLVGDLLEAGEARLGAAYVDEVRRQQADSQPGFDLAVALCLYLASPESDGITGKLLSAVWDPWQNLQQYREELEATDIYTLRRIVPKDRGKAWGGRAT